MSRRIDFIVAGVQKGGTTALFEHLRRDLALSLPAEKELHYFDDEALDWACPDYDSYHARFDWSSRRPRGEATPIYLYWPNALERMAAYRADIRLILIFRDPVQRAWSQWGMERAREWETLTFKAVVDLALERLRSGSVAVHRIHSYVERGFYGRQLARALSLFPREQLFLLRSEDLAATPGRSLAAVADFLGVEPPPVDVARLRANAGEGGRCPPAIARTLADVYRSDLQVFAELSGLDVSGWLQGG